MTLKPLKVWKPRKKDTINSCKERLDSIKSQLKSISRIEEIANNDID